MRLAEIFSFFDIMNLTILDEAAVLLMELSLMQTT